MANEFVNFLDTHNRQMQISTDQRKRFYANVCFTFCCLLSMASVLFAQEPNSVNSKKEEPIVYAPSERLLAAIELGDIKINLTPMGESGKRGIGWSPKGNKVPLTTQDDALVGEFRIGKLKRVRLELLLEPKQGGDGVLHIDLNSDDHFSDEEAFKVTPSLTRKKYWYSFKLSVELPFAGESTRPYPFSLWYVVDPQEESPEKIIRWSRRGWHEGVFEFDNQTCTAVVSDRNSDGIFNERDAWGLGQTSAEAYSSRNSTSSIGKHAWLDGIAFQVSDIPEHGQSITVRAFDLGISEEDDRKRMDPYRLDREYARAAKPVTFAKDLEEALTTARTEQKRVVVDFVTTWCGPCRVMDQLVYTAKPVVEKADEFIFVKLDGDEQKELKDKYQVEAFPTLILLDSNGEVVRKAVGYQSVKKMLDFLR